MKTILCILALLVLTASTADAYVRRTVGGGYYGRGCYGHPVARGAAVAASAAADWMGLGSARLRRRLLRSLWLGRSRPRRLLWRLSLSLRNRTANAASALLQLV